MPPIPARMSERRTTIIGALLTAIGPLSMAIYTPAMPELVRAFETTEAAIKMSLSLYFAGFALAQLVAGPVSDAFGRKSASLSFLAIYLAGSLLSTFAPTVEWVLAGRLVQGIGASVGITVSRAIVRDQFNGGDAARIINTMGIILAIGPSLGPTVGGLALAVFGWRSVFMLMVGFGALLVFLSTVCMTETTVPDRSRLKPLRLVQAYAEIISLPRFLFAALVLAGSVGSMYAQAAVLPFIMIEKVGLTPTEFGMGMLMQSGFFLLGSVCLRIASRWLPTERAPMVGLIFSGSGAIIMALSVHFLPPTFLSIMGPVALCAFGIAFISPYMTAAGLMPFPHIAGSASAMMGFLQMGAGFLGGVAAASIGSPLPAFGIIIPAMHVTAVIGYIGYRAASRKV
ncbi:multidrug effflux MFS transporter [Rhizobium terrae]|uniref:multidrug effflux MFS transporter n=1 Tax=Rhizobium terrae TaxID=2171756 RepID=UPI0038572374